jgi:hypothetical protein
MYLRHPCYLGARLAYAILTAWLGSCTKLANKPLMRRFQKYEAELGRNA